MNRFEEQQSVATSQVMMLAILNKLNDLEEKIDGPQAELPVTEAVTGYREYLKTHHRKPENYTYLLKLFADHFTGERNMADITAVEIEEFTGLYWMRSTLIQRTTQLKGFFSWAIKYQKKMGKPSFPNPCEIIEGEKIKTRRPDFIPEQTFAPVFKDISVQDRLIFSIPLSSGLRVSELIKLRPCDVEKDGRLLILHEPKSGRDLEHAVIPSELGRLLAEYIKGRSIRSDGLIFPMSRQVAGNVVYRLMRKAGLYLSVHSLRKWCATFWNRAGDREMESFVLRHSSTDLRDRYVAPLTIEEAMERQDNHLSPLFKEGGGFWG